MREMGRRMALQIILTFLHPFVNIHEFSPLSNNFSSFTSQHAARHRKKISAVAQKPWSEIKRGALDSKV